MKSSFWHILADNNYANWEVQRADGGAGAILDYVLDVASGRVDIQVRNVTSAAIASGSILYFAVRRK